MTSLAAAEAALPGVHGLVFFGFPLHPAGRPSTERAAHLERVHLPMLFLQGERDRLAQLDLLRPICAGLDARATLHVVPTADHGFHVLRSSGQQRCRRARAPRPHGCRMGRRARLAPPHVRSCS